jgi:hypothetical protein
MRIVRDIIPEFGRGSAVAALVLIGELVEMRHFRSGTSARDHFDQLFAVENSLVQIGRLSRRARIATTVAIYSVAELAICFVLEQALAEGCVLSRHGIGQHEGHYRSGNRGYRIA